MLRQFFCRLGRTSYKSCRCFTRTYSSDRKDETRLRDDLKLRNLYLDDIDKIMSDNNPLEPVEKYYPNLDLDQTVKTRPQEGHNLVVIQPWVAYANFGEYTDPDLQLDECVSLGNTIHNWKVVDKRIVFANQLHRSNIVGKKAFGELKELIQSRQGVSAVFFGVELLSAIQLATLEKELKLAVYDRFTVVLNIFRQHARTKEAKLQLALAEIPYIRSHLREISQSTEYSSSASALKMLIGGEGEKFFHRRLTILKRREIKLKQLLADVAKQRELNKRQRKKSDIPVISVVGYTNSGKTTLIKYLTEDPDLVPKDQLFATLDVTTHVGQLPSSKTVFYVDTIGFLSRIPSLLIESFSATLKDVQESDLIIHVLDVSHPDHRLQYATVINSLEQLKVSKNLLETRLTIGNKVDLLLDREEGQAAELSLPKCNLNISATKGTNLAELVQLISQQLMANIKYDRFLLRVENGGKKYAWLRRNSTVVSCEPDKTDGNYLFLNVIMSPATAGRWNKQFGGTEVINEEKNSVH